MPSVSATSSPDEEPSAPDDADEEPSAPDNANQEPSAPDNADQEPTGGVRSPGSPSGGTLFVVGTPIGNLGDITLRAIETLRSVDRVAAEDTRRTRGLLSHLGILSKPIDCIEAHVSESRLARLVERLEQGRTVALVTDAGMPCLSDPGAAVIERARAAGIPVVVVPGPSAVTTAIAASGLVEGAFYFAGFLPRQGTRRRRALKRLSESVDAAVLFEAPSRTATTLGELARSQPERPAAVCRELTKLHEEIQRGTLSELAASEAPWRGEVVIVLGPYDDETQASASDPGGPSDVELVAALREGQSVRALLDGSGFTGASRRALYRRLLALRDQADPLVPTTPPASR